ncbi:NAD-glutamate dehydrogenase [Pseudarthrobacter sp. HLT3-5]|uniref:NAD-glutamate dehydrogenase n=1 Tax=Pseudarthrobacter cellobiosi TaxID=2953654 RepID=UPI00208F9C4A|nr:NAD-glutamate dehydrogenase [Pseudarthrobacter sp. HLT3-5]MCO4273480.1 NAD-glutamate dehydrogenase [Pseudarthrobacter sp. HLT3-5]
MSRETAPAAQGGAAGPFEANDSFFADYYEHVAAEDLLDYSPETLGRRARYHAALAGIRAPGQSVVGVLNETDASIVMVVANDMPHLVHSVTAELTRESASIRLLVHPTFRVRRDPETHALLDVAHGPSRAGLTAANAGHAEIPDVRPDELGGDQERTTETWVAVEIGRLTGDSGAEEVIANLRGVLADVQAVAEDLPAIHAQVTAAVGSVDGFPSATVPAPDQLRELLLWLDNGNFVFLGYSEYERTTAGGRDALRVRAGAGLGLLREDRPEGGTGPASGAPHTEGPGEASLHSPRALTLATSDLRSSVPRPAYLDEIRLRILDDGGAVAGERRFVGLLAPGATGQSVRRIPVVRDKVLAVQEHLGFKTASHQGKELLAVLESFPLDELFHMEEHDLAQLATEILRLQQRRQTRLFLRPDSIGRFMSALVFLPRRRYNTAVRLRIEQELRHAFKSPSIEFEVRLGDSPMARVFFRILLGPGTPAPDVDPLELERRVVAASRSWTEGLDESLRDRFTAEEAARLSTLWQGSFPPGYRADHDAEDAVRDIAAFEEFDLDGTGGRALDNPLLTVYVRPEATRPPAEDARMRLYLTSAQSLTRFLPFLHNLGLEVLDQRPFELRRASGQDLFLYDLGLKYPPGIDPLETSMLLADSFCAAMRGDIESDGFDALVIREAVSWRQAVVLRSYAKYLQQLGTLNSYGFMADTLLSNTRATHALLALFHAKFVPGIDWTRRLHDTAAARKELMSAIEEIPSLDADRLLRTFMNLIEATLRTNYFLDRPHVSFKLSPAAIPNAPFPRPKFEIWVYSPRVEGVHLRFGMLARGGLRWSNRSEDFRTEVLGLVKAQNVKNSVIVPTGAKGGFYAKRLPDPAIDRAAWMAEGQESYRIFIRGMLDLTDNLLGSGNGGTVVAPKNVVRHDGDDYYLVVAADKGTAAFSDTANEVAHAYGFWLDDAFASGGSVGYDHKEMGITARGVWASVKQHFSELGLDTQQENFTVAGIGDMSGDVFGNGMLLSRHIVLVAAFDHRHIFLDPNPDPDTSYAERRRLFGLPRSSWAEYDARAISAGGGVYPRSAKTVPISDPVRVALGLERGRSSMAPQELLQAILRAPVDLIYNGGIGTYIKASSETQAEVGDKANDAIRINGHELRARVIAEGGNLGVTQRGRIEAALHGVLLNTDAIDNSAGVDCSDHEVNIKIFVDAMIAAGLMRREERTGFLHSLADEVARLVLKDNTEQNALLVAERQLVLNWSPGFERTMDWLETTADLDRNLEGLPSTAALHARLEHGEGLTSPELSVLAAYAKIELARELNASDLADDPWFHQALRSYFPRQIVERFGAELDRHPLCREIVGTVMANDIVNIGGITFAFRAIEETTASAAAVARAFVVLREAYDLDSIVAALAALPPEFPSKESAGVALHMRRLLDRATRWYVTHDHRDQPISEALARIKPTLDILRTKTSHYLRGADLDLVEDRLAHWDSVGLPAELGKRASDLLESFALLDISLISEQVREPVTAIIDVHFAIFERIGVVRLLLRITDLPRANRWEALARAALRDDAYSAAADMTTSVMKSTPQQAAGVDAVERIVAWERGYQEQLARIKDTFAEVTKPGDVDIASISVALKLLRTLVRR